MDLSEIRRAIRSGLRPLEAVAPLRLSQWAAEHFYLSAESSYVEQHWAPYPYQPAIMDCMSHDEIEEVDVEKSARVGYTKMLLAAIAYFAEHRRRNQAVWQPTDEDSDEFVKTELEPMIRDVPAIGRVFPEFLAKHRHNTLRQKIFLGSMLHLRGGKAAKNYRRLSVSVAMLDEIDGFDLDVEGEGSPIELARKRIEGATYPKLIVGSTPKTRQLSMIEARGRQAGLRFQYHVPCKHCGAEHTLRWGGKKARDGFKWIDNDPNTARHLCPACGALTHQADYLAMWTLGRWIAPNGAWIDPECVFRDWEGNAVPPPKSVAFHIWTAYSPQTTWAQIVRQYLSALAKARAGDIAELKTFINTTRGESFEEDVEKADQSDLKRRAEPFPLRLVQLGALVLVAGVDVQDDRFEILVWGIGRGEEMWTVDRMVLTANPADEREWEERLWPYLQSKFPHVAGGKLAIEAIAIDTGGHFTHQAYNFCRSHMRQLQRIYAVRGETKYGQPVKGRASLQDVNWRGKIIKNGVKLWHVGTDTAKDLLFARFKVMQPGPGYLHFSSDLPDEFFEQLTAEARMPQRTAQGEQHRWVKLKGGARNEALDCTVYAIFAAHMRDLHRYTERMWERLEAAVQPPTGDMFHGEPASVSLLAAAAALPKPVQTSATVRPMRTAHSSTKGFVKGWKNG
jgi:phage terminase large subunit GpA-like protein